MTGYYLYRIEFVRSFWQIKRYPVQTLAAMLGLGLIFFLILGAGKMVSNGALNSEGTTNLILTYVLGMLVMSVVSGPSSTIWGEAKSGTLEHLYMSIHPLGKVFIARTIGGLLTSLIQITILLVALLWLTSTELVWSWLMMIPLVIALVSALGLGLLIGGLAMLVKDTSSIFVLVQLLLFALSGLPFSQAFWTYFLPISPGTSLIRFLATGGVLSIELILPALVSSVMYFCLGYFILNKSLKLAQGRGLLGHE